MLSLNSLKRLRNNLLKTPDILRAFDDIIKQQIESNILERVTEEGKVGEVVYIPHKAVVRKDKQTTKVRIVLNASAERLGRASTTVYIRVQI